MGARRLTREGKAIDRGCSEPRSEGVLRLGPANSSLKSTAVHSVAAFALRLVVSFNVPLCALPSNDCLEGPKALPATYPLSSDP